MFDDYPDCQDCGACCVSSFDMPNYVHVTNEDAETLQAVDLGHLLFEERLGNGRTLFSMKTCRDKRDNCRCAALDGTVGESVSCTIYDDRTTACRRFERGSDLCEYARREVLGVSDK